MADYCSCKYYYTDIGAAVSYQGSLLTLTKLSHYTNMSKKSQNIFPQEIFMF